METKPRYLLQLGILAIVLFSLSCSSNPAGNEEEEIPDITVSPSSGSPGTLVTISGEGIPTDLELTGVTFNGVVSRSAEIIETGKLEAMVPIGATTGSITIYGNSNVNQGEISGPSFEVTGIGTLELEASTSGSSKDLDGFIALVEPGGSQGIYLKSFDGNDNLTVEGIPVGTVTVSLLAVDSYCTYSGEEIIDLTENSSFPIEFGFSCSDIVLSEYIAYESSDIVDNKEIYLKSNNDNLFHNPNEKTGSVRLTDHPASDIEPAISPDGKSIAFSSDRDGDFDLYLLDINSMQLEQLTFANEFDNMDPVWSPDGTKIYFETDRNGNWDIYALTLTEGTEEAFLNSEANEVDITFAFEKSHYAYASDETGAFEVVLLKEGSTPLRLAFDEENVDPALSKDGSLLAFNAKSGNSSSMQIFSIDSNFYISGYSASGSNYLAPAFATDNALLYVLRKEQPSHSTITAIYPDDHQFFDWEDFHITGEIYDNPDMGVYLPEN